MSHIVPGRKPVEEALRARRALHELLVVDANDELAQRASQQGLPVRVLTKPLLDERTGGVLHQGVAAVAPAFPYVALHELDGDLVVVLDGVTDPQNVGAIARSAEAAGAAGMVLPRRRSAHVSPAAEKAAAGALSWLPVAVVPNVSRALVELAGRGMWSVGLAEQASQTVWECGLLDGPTVVVVGSEGTGLSRLVAERCDALVAIPMAGRVGSLNASVAAAVVLFEVRRRARG